MENNNPLIKVINHKLDKNPPGVYSICNANPFVINANMKLAKEKNLPLLIESTCNQVNQFGGYMNMTPDDFIKYIKMLARKWNYPDEKIYFGGDHLGPSVWINEPSDVAMAKAEKLVHDYVLSGYSKIHLDTSMSCSNDPVPLPKQVIAQRQARLCQIAEDANSQLDQKKAQLWYVVGTEVPTPGGAVSETDKLDVTSVQETTENIQMTETFFHQKGLDEAWKRTIAFVVQPGVEFGDTLIHAYDREKAANLSDLIENYDALVYESHSTDYQSRASLRKMVKDHFAILKVGPALTFAMREAFFALALIEKELFANNLEVQSFVIETLDRVMLAKPDYWKKYYKGDDTEQSFKRKYSYSDRSRYYWPEKNVQSAIQKLIDNLSNKAIPLSLLSQYLPMQHEKIREGSLQNEPLELIYSKVIGVAEDYVFACNEEN